ncbi:hypothetical protein AK812_SmicGene449 [Symbiodinium microadriaticum]|uniref:EF-hand domain-containing protein n=1 Tax=Symbiodinium microadriaticum TaxID=2951 RepID=A0A1Q9F6U3_SYMMI|nr:hypothetical protein AK812_SmicGene449 [Symbiodinium microadriaticum]
MGFAVIGVINAVLMQETFKVAYLDDTVMVREKVKAMRHHVAKMSELFHGADTSRDGKLDLEDIFRMWLAAMELDVSNVEELFKMLNTNGDGRLSATELVQGLAALFKQGPLAGSIHVLSSRTYRNRAFVISLVRAAELCRLLDPEMKELFFGTVVDRLLSFVPSPDFPASLADELTELRQSPETPTNVGFSPLFQKSCYSMGKTA